MKSWYTKVPPEPEFTQQAFQALAMKLKEAEQAGRATICSLMIDEMAMKKHVSWDGTRFRGYVDLGNGVEDDDSTPVAKDALVLMVVSVNSSWEIPCGYFFVDGLSGIERANLVKICFEKLHDVGVNVLSLKCDGPSCHFSMLTELGANLQPLNLKQYFLCPLDPK